MTIGRDPFGERLERQSLRTRMTYILDQVANSIAGGARQDPMSFVPPPQALSDFDFGQDQYALEDDFTPPEGLPGEPTDGDMSNLPTYGDVVQETQGLINGRIPREKLVAVSGNTLRQGYLLPSAAKSWEIMRAAARRDGVYLGYVDAYRSWESQNAGYQKWLRGEKSAPVAPPGKSKHGAGLALDITNGQGIVSRSSTQFQWLTANAARFGWYGIRSESWHWEYRGV